MSREDMGAQESSGNVGLQPYAAVGMQARMEEARALFRNPDTTEFVIVPIPTVMAHREGPGQVHPHQPGVIAVHLMQSGSHWKSNAYGAAQHRKDLDADCSKDWTGIVLSSGDAEIAFSRFP